MPVRPKDLTATQIKDLKDTGRHRVADGLYLNISATGSRSWYTRPEVNGKRTWKKVADGEVSVVIARKLALTAEPEDTAKTRPFEVVWDEYIERNEKSWKSAIHHRQWMQTGRDYILPEIGHMRIDTIRPEHIANILRPLWTEKHESARRIRGRIALVIDAELARLGLLQANPADLRFIKPQLQRYKQVETHHAAPTVDELKKLLKTLGDDASHQCLRWVAMTACRTSEARFATTAEVVDGIWTLPAERMKANKEHRVLAPWQPDGEGYLFLYRKKPLSLNAMRSILVKRKLPWTVHGIRSCFSSWATEQGYDSRLIERQLAHTDENQVRAAYDRSDLFEQRAAMMQKWWAVLQKK